jgi:hypothetical protein
MERREHSDRRIDAEKSVLHGREESILALGGLASVTKPQKLLLAAALLQLAGQKPFTLEALAVKAWELDKKSFGLKGFDYPDSNPIYTYMMGVKSLPAKGMFLKVAQKMYELTQQGEAYVLAVLSESPPDRISAVKLDSNTEEQLTRLFFTKAFRRWESKFRSQITYADAIQFWQIGGDGSYVDDALYTTALVIHKAEMCLVGGILKLSSGQEVAARELTQLKGVHTWMLVQFARNLENQRKSTSSR